MCPSPGNLRRDCVTCRHFPGRHYKSVRPMRYKVELAGAPESTPEKISGAGSARPSIAQLATKRGNGVASQFRGSFFKTRHSAEDTRFVGLDLGFSKWWEEKPKQTDSENSYNELRVGSRFGPSQTSSLLTPSTIDHRVLWNVSGTPNSQPVVSTVPLYWQWSIAINRLRGKTNHRIGS